MITVTPGTLLNGGGVRRWELRGAMAPPLSPPRRGWLWVIGTRAGMNLGGIMQGSVNRGLLGGPKTEGR